MSVTSFIQIFNMKAYYLISLSLALLLLGSLEQVYSFRIQLFDRDFKCKPWVNSKLTFSLFCFSKKVNWNRATTQDGRRSVACKFVKIQPALAPIIPILKYEDVPVFKALKKEPKYMTLIRFWLSKSWNTLRINYNWMKYIIVECYLTFNISNLNNHS